jgi:lysophospholipase L1-like esterase
VVFFLNERYGLLAKAGRVVLGEGRVPGMAAPYEMNRNYQVRRGIFHLDRNEAARVLMLGDSLTAQGEWNAMLVEPLVANRGIDGDTSAGLLARVEDDADFRGDAVVIWIGTNDVLQGHAAGPVVENISKAVVELKVRTADVTDQHENFEPRMARMGTDKGEEEAGLRSASQAGVAFLNPSTSGLAQDSAYTSPTRSASGPASALRADQSGKGSGGGNQLADSEVFFKDQSRAGLQMDSEKLLDTRGANATDTSGVQTGSESESVVIRDIRGQNSLKVFVFSVAPMARWWEGARERNGTIREINAALAANATGEGYVFVDLNPVLADGDGFLRGELTSDGVHLSAKGYEAVLEKLKESGLF